MSGNALDTLFLPLERGDVPVNGQSLFLGAAHHAARSLLKDCALWQPFKPWADSLGSEILADIPEQGDYNLVLVNLPKQTEEAKAWLAHGLRLLTGGGVLLAAADNDAGGGRIEKWMKELGFSVQSLSKHKARAVWGVRPENPNHGLMNDWISSGDVQSVDMGDGIVFQTRPGVFSWDRIDKGSSLLAHHLPADIKGAGADFGCGIGYLSYVLLRRIHAISDVHLIEADLRALSCALENLKSFSHQVKIHPHWHDLAKPIPALPPLDFVIMNPPFHQGSSHNIGIGQAFIVNAAHHLKKNGNLFMVANCHLPYEDHLKQYFSHVKLVVQKDGFKIIEAQK